jgi:hypothetical protein
MLFSALEAQDAAIIIGACGGLVVAILAPLLKALVDIRRQTSETNAAVNNRPKGDATLRELVEQIDERLDALEGRATERHESNVRRIDRMSIAVDQTIRKVDRVQDAVAGVNSRMDRVEQERQERDGP